MPVYLQEILSLNKYKRSLDQTTQDINGRISGKYNSIHKGPQFSSIQSLSCVQLFVTPWTAIRQASLSITNSWSFLKLMFIKLVMPSNHLILCHPLLFLHQYFPVSGSFLVSQFFPSGGHGLSFLNVALGANFFTLLFYFHQETL